MGDYLFYLIAIFLKYQSFSKSKYWSGSDLRLINFNYRFPEALTKFARL
jgi:hypothetical protein